MRTYNVNLINERFGNLVVLSFYKKGGRKIWKCICDCGNEKEAYTHNLTSHQTKSCGCLKDKEMLGKKFGMLTVLRKVGYDSKNRRSKWLCSCDCGGEIVTYSRYLQRASRTDCGCKDKERAKNIGLKLRKPESQANNKWASYVHNAKRKGMDFSLTKEESQQIFKENCFYCGDLPSPLNGIDRVDNSLGYILSNCVPCCKTCNMLKSNVNKVSFLNHIRKIADHCKEEKS